MLNEEARFNYFANSSRDIGVALFKKFINGSLLSNLNVVNSTTCYKIFHINRRQSHMISVAIDGPSGAGKSTLARRLAIELGYVYVDTGAMYRAIGLYTLRNMVNTKTAQDVEKLLPNIDLKLLYEDGEQHIYLNNEDVSRDIRAEEVSMAASDVSAHRCVREFLLDTQRRLSCEYNVIMDGRDIGTVILPKAQVKIFLTATAEERAKRRYKELVEKGVDTSYDKVLADVQQRDYNDTHRDIAPLRQADGATLADTTSLNFEQAYSLLLSIIKENS